MRHGVSIRRGSADVQVARSNQHYTEDLAAQIPDNVGCSYAGKTGQADDSHTCKVRASGTLQKLKSLDLECSREDSDFAFTE